MEMMAAILGHPHLGYNLMEGDHEVNHDDDVDDYAHAYGNVDHLL